MHTKWHQYVLFTVTLYSSSLLSALPEIANGRHSSKGESYWISDVDRM